MKNTLILITLMLLAICARAQDGTVTGTVTSSEGPVPGVTIYVEGTTNGTTTDIDGKFTLKVQGQESIIIISSIGFKTIKIPYQGQSSLGEIMLEEDLSELAEVIVIGYGTATKKELSSSIATVKSEDLNRMTVANVSESLQGLASGVQVVNAGGAPGSAPQILIRGVVSTSSTAPLIVVDGIPLPEGTNLNFLNPADIKDMQILKDGSASSIYGTRGSNGVILVTTLRGKQGEASITASASYGLKELSKPSLANADEYARVMNERQTNDGQPPLWDLANLVNDTDWWNEVYKDLATRQNYNLQINGGSEKINYLASMSYYRDESHLQKGYYERLTARFNIDYAITDKLFFRQDISPRYEHWENTPNLFSSVITIDPLTPVYIPIDEREGRNEFSIYARSNNTVWNPVGAVARNFNKSYFFGLFSTSKLTYEISDNFSVSSQIGLNISQNRNDVFNPQFQIFPSQEERFESQVYSGFTNQFGYVWNNLVNYDQSFGKHSVSATAGIVFERNQINWISGSRTDILLNDPKFRFLNATTGDGINANGNEGANSLQSYIGRVRYNFAEKYFILGSFRRDGSSRFPSSNRWANFYSVSGAWNISEESFFNASFVSNLKLKAGFGQVGNQDIPESAYLFLVDNGDYVFGQNEDRVITNYISQFGNPNLQWETVEDLNIGVEGGVFDNMFTLSIDWYNKKSKGLLFPTSLPLYSGAPSTILQNVGSFESKGLDINLGYNDEFGEFKINATLTLNTNESRALELAPGNDRILAARRGNFGNNYLKVTELGGIVGMFYGYQSNGIFQSQAEINSHSTDNGTLIQPVALPGDIRFVDQNNDGVINEDDITTIGNPFPDFYGGLNLNLTFKNWDMNMQWYGTYGNDIYNYTKSYRISGVSQQNVQAGLINDVWREDNTGAKYPRLSVLDPNRNFNRSSDLYVEDGSYLRLKNLQIGYNFNLPFAKQLRVYISGQNLLTFTNYSGFDPEVSGGIIDGFGIDYGRYPLSRIYLLGLNMSF